MPDIGRIQSTTFQTLLTRLGIVRNEVPFVLRSEVSPVVLVGGEVAFVAAPTPPYAVTDYFSGGLQAAPPVNTVLADTGALPVGAYTIQVITMCEEAGFFDFQWRDVPNTASLVRYRYRVATTLEDTVWNIRLNVENAGERFRVTNTVVGGGGFNYEVGIFAKI